MWTVAVSVAVLCVVSFGALASEPVGIADMAALEWGEVAPGVWSARIGGTDGMTFTDLAGGAPQTDALGALGAAPFPFAERQARAGVRNGRSSVRLPLEPDEQIYGLGLQFRNINRRGEVYHLRMDHYGGVLGRTHAPVPFYVSSVGYGVLFNTVRWVSVYPGIGNRKDSSLPPIRDRTTDPQWQARPASDAVEATAMASGMEVLVFTGPTPLDAVRRYNLYFGGGCLPPRWGLGFWHRVPTHATDEQVYAEVDEFAKRDFPLDVVGLEPGWQSRAYPCTFDWNSERFPNPAGFVKTMADRGLQVNLWENPYVSPESSIYEAIEPLTGSHTVWLGIVPDYTLPEARTILADHHARTHVDIGVSGYKIDEVDGVDAWLWPDHATFPSGMSAEDMRQTYGLQLQQILTDIYRDRNRRTYGLVRGSNGGASAYPFVIYSDYYDHRGYVTALCNSGFAGVLWTPEIRSAGSEREWVRRMQTVCFSPMAMLNAWASGMKPWSKPEVDAIIRETMKWRIRLLPYLYTAFARYRFEGIPPFRAMVLEPGFLPTESVEAGTVDGDKNPYAEAVCRDITDQYMMGDCLMVAAVFAGQKKRDVVLPQGKWYDFYTGAFAGGGEVITIETALDKLPLYVKDGGIIPVIDAANNTSAWAKGVALEVRHYGEAEGSTMLYDDDGATFDYETGARSWYTLSVSRDGGGKLQGTVTRDTGEYPQTFGEVSWKFMTE
jgi:alpha-D-xyloside xylohydrolase